ncbi:3-hydroxyacyl-CoA dehydrogenase NAD-binding domain-containing protein [Denitratisoma oestradiolicum]|uniref:enoyl-CoA hydratase n=1 Tax=Denitratisoma oestradiolicum TaxID=311182 RepID=A0A6S6XY82_9PROT|nr:3-hydroxyacyl-CoA dehydrogenase NAD-binding domain-containing protein [Denitratisoma oestradiolicum]TWO80740.1 3-hydroxyacyl-CoA dehydrogenase [Denitratisoma oestradiolicum]CAB1370954.1 3-hydroxyacyl-CoA dehydrogenase [Denitratisoma oestradiolicum]
MRHLKLDTDAQGVALLTIDVADRPMNVLMPEVEAELAEAVARVRADAGIRGLIIVSGKANGFIAGADLKEFVEAYERKTTQAQGAERSRQFQRLFRSLETCGKPVAIAMNGLALGGGLELCLAGHYRVLSDNPKAVVGLPECGIGLLPGAGGTQRLPRLIGVENALPMMLSGRHVKPAEALKLGIVHELATPGEEVAVARRWIDSQPDPRQPWDKPGFRVEPASVFIAETRASTLRETHGNYPAPLAILGCVAEGVPLPIDDGLEVEARYFGQLLAGPVARNLIRTTFINRGLADKLARRPKGIDKAPAQKLAVLGAGTMGGGIAFAAAQAGIPVVLLDSSGDLAERAKAAISVRLAQDVAKGRLAQDKADALLARITPTADYALLADCDFAIEAVFEDAAIKAQVIARAEAALPATAVFASNTSALPIGGLARTSLRPGQFVGMHFFSPVERMVLVEIIAGQETRPETLARTFDLAGQLKKTPILVNDGPGFYSTRVVNAYINEGLDLLTEGVAPALIEDAARQAGMPVGPLALADEVGLDLGLKIARQVDTLEAGRSRAVATLDQMVRQGRRVGRKSGTGFYDYPEGGAKRLWPGLAALYPPAAEQPGVEEIKQRLLYAQALEAARCVEDGVVTHMPDGDLGSLLGWGFPSYTGGTLSLIDTLGIANFVEACERLAARHGVHFAPSAWLKEKAGRGENFYPPVV